MLGKSRVIQISLKERVPNSRVTQIIQIIQVIQIIQIPRCKRDLDRVDHTNQGDVPLKI